MDTLLSAVQDRPIVKILKPGIMASEQKMEDFQADDEGGIGIIKLFEGKNILITGATGLLGKALVEKLLRSTSVGKIYLLIKAKDENAASRRLKNEIIHSDLFTTLKEKHGDSYEEFARKKLIPIVGNICEPNLGMDPSAIKAIQKDLEIIIESAAITAFNGRYDLLLDANVMGPKRLMSFAKSCKNLKLFTHISTVYVNRGRERMLLPETIGDYVRNVNASFSQMPDITHEISMASEKALASRNDVKELKKLGQERAELYGWSNAYQLSKVMAEMILNENKDNVPLLIIRPSTIESTYKDPFPGWIQGLRMHDPIITSYGKGQLPAFLADPDSYTDVIPVDIAASTIIAAIAKHLRKHNTQENVYHVASSMVNPLKVSDFFGLIHEGINAKPLVASDDNNIPQIKLFDNFKDVSKYIIEDVSRRSLMQPLGSTKEKTILQMQRRCKAMIANAELLCKTYEFGTFFYARFHTGNTQKLLREMSNNEKLTFDVDATNIDWRKYFIEIHIPGLRKHVLNSKL